ncbi:steroid delta-isomerase [Prosthecobacter sp.]|uniref:steroid delta-isomerase n=1 Tax=Prosthecobacter sp. TaxID=1965333 RepID=UPI003784CACB
MTPRPPENPGPPAFLSPISTSTTASPATLIQQQLDACNAHDLDALLATYAPDARLFEHPSPLAPAPPSSANASPPASRLQDPHLLNRLIMGRFIIGHQRVTRTFLEGPGTLELIATYEVSADNSQIINAWFLSGPKTLDPQS